MSGDRKRDAAYVAGGAVAGTAAMPVRAKGNAKSNPYAKLPAGVHDIPTRTAQKASRRTGPRLQNRRYTAALAQHIDREQKAGRAIKPTQVHVYNDKSFSQVQGAHRLWARSMLGEKSVPVEVTHIDTPRPAGRRAAHEALAEVQTRHQRRRLKQDTGLGEKKINRLARGLHPVAARYNRKHATKGNANPLSAGKLGQQMSNRTLRMKQGKWVAGGTAVGAAAAGVHHKLSQDKVHKSSMSAFGVDHGEVFEKGRKAGGLRPGTDSYPSMTHRGGPGYTAPTPEQLSASKARRVTQSQDKAKRIADKPFKRVGGGKEIPWAVHRAGMGAKGPRNLAILAGTSLGTAGALGAYHHQVSKADTKQTRDVAVGTALGGAAGFTGTKAGVSAAGTAGKIHLKNRRAARGQSPHEAKIWAQHAKEHTVTYKPGQPAPWKSYAKYPKQLPDWKAQRLLAHKNNPKVALGTAVAGTALGAATGGLSMRRKRD